MREASARRRRASVTVALATTALAALLACGDDRDGPPAPTPAPSGTPVATTTPLPPPTPTAADPGTFTIAEDLPATTGVAAAFGGGRYLVTFSVPTDRTASDLVGVRLAADGTVLDSPPLLLSDLGDAPFLGPDGAYFPGGIAFASGSFGTLFFGSATTPTGAPGQIVGFVGVPVDGPPALRATAIDEQLSFSMVQTALVAPIPATSNGTLFLALYQRIVSMVAGPTISEVVGQIVTADPQVEAQEIGPFSGRLPSAGDVVTSGSAPGVATRSDAAALAAWVEWVVPLSMPASMTYRLQGVVLTESDATPVTLAEVAENSLGGFVATDGSAFLALWTTATDASPDVRSELRAIRFTPGGEPEPTGGFVVAGGAAAKSLAGVVFAAGEYLVAWTEDGALRGARLGTTGDAVETLALDPGPVADAALATDGTQVLVVVDRADAGGTSDVLGRFVD